MKNEMQQMTETISVKPGQTMEHVVLKSNQFGLQGFEVVRIDIRDTQKELLVTLVGKRKNEQNNT